MLQKIDIIILIVYLSVTIVIGLVLKKRAEALVCLYHV